MTFFYKFIEDQELVRKALSLLSKWGKCVYFENDPKLSSIVVLAPHFLSKTTLAGLFRLGVDAEAKRETGVIHHQDLPVFWPDLAKRSDFETTAFLLVELLEKFDLCFVLPEDLGKPFFEQRSTFPSLLPPFPKVKIVRNESSLAAHSISEQEFEISSLGQTLASRSSPPPTHSNGAGF